jgi:hypothetical protein
MRYTLGQAAKATGKGKTTIQRAVAKGLISAEKGRNGEYQIDPAELHRVFPIGTRHDPVKTLQNTSRKSKHLKICLLGNEKLWMRSGPIGMPGSSKLRPSCQDHSRADDGGGGSGELCTTEAQRCQPGR